jgi:dTDP-4-dehydrorhamnose 3,5-epimerase
MGTTVKDLTTHVDDRGYLIELLRNDDSFFKQFGQVYTSAINPGVVKGFHKHSRQTEHITCIHGQVRLVLVDERGGTPVVEEYHLSPLSPKMVVVEPEVWYGWRSVSQGVSLLINVTDTPFDASNPDGTRIDPHLNPWGYSWEVKDR